MVLGETSEALLSTDRACRNTILYIIQLYDYSTQELHKKRKTLPTYSDFYFPVPRVLQLSVANLSARDRVETSSIFEDSADNSGV